MTERWVKIKGEKGPEYVNMAHVRHIGPVHGGRALLTFANDTDEIEVFLLVSEPPEHFLPPAVCNGEFSDETEVWIG